MRGSLLAVALAATMLVPTVSALGHVAATGRVSGTYKPLDCGIEATVAFDVDLDADDGHLELTPDTFNDGCSLTGVKVTLWDNFCSGDVDQRIVCGDDDLNTTEIATAILQPDGSFAYEDERWRLDGTLVREDVGV